MQQSTFIASLYLGIKVRLTSTLFFLKKPFSCATNANKSGTHKGNPILIGLLFIVSASININEFETRITIKLKTRIISMLLFKLQDIFRSAVNN